MTAARPLRALRYDTNRVDLSRVIVPPYDVIADDERGVEALESADQLADELMAVEQGEDARHSHEQVVELCPVEGMWLSGVIS